MIAIEYLHNRQFVGNGVIVESQNVACLACHALPLAHVVCVCLLTLGKEIRYDSHILLLDGCGLLGILAQQLILLC